MSEIPSHIGACEFGMLGRQVAVRCPREFDTLMRKASVQPTPTAATAPRPTPSLPSFLAS